MISGLAGVIGVYYLSIILVNNKKISFLLSILLAFHPYYYLLSYSFMTDVPFFAFVIWSIYFYTKVIEDNKTLHLLIAVILNIIALLIRDLGIIIPAAFAFGYSIKYGINYKKLVRIFSPFFLILLTFILWRIWIEYFHGVPKLLDHNRERLFLTWTNGINNLLSMYLKNILYSILYIGIYGVPIIILLLNEYYSRLTKKVKYLSFILIIILTSILIISLILRDNIIVYFLDLLTTHLVGHIFLWPGVHSPTEEFVFFIPKMYLILITSLGLISGICLIIIIFHRSYKYYQIYQFKIMKTQNGVVEFILLIITAYLFIMYSQYMVHRYLILPLILIYCLSSYKLIITRKSSFLIKFIFFLFFFYNIYNSVSAAHDMMSYNRMRWKALNYLNNELNIKPEQIDGGFEYNAWYFYSYNYVPTENKNWWYVQDDEYVVTWGKINGYEVIKEYDYYRWFPPCFNGKIFILKKEN
jgi:hypothetical protein